MDGSNNNSSNNNNNNNNNNKDNVIKSTPIEKKPLDWLVKMNDFLEKFPKAVLTYFDGIVLMGEETTQAYVDACCRYVAWRVNITIERVRQNIIKALCGQYRFVLKILKIIKIGKEIISNPLGVIGSFFSTITKPYETATYYIKTLAKELPRLSKNLSNITAVLPPKPPSPDINYDEFQIQIKTISMDDVLNGDLLPPPEEAFPEPPKPFSREVFQASFEEGSAAYRKATKNAEIKYKPKTTKVSGGESNTNIA